MTSNVRERKVGANGIAREEAPKRPQYVGEETPKLSVLDILRVIAGLLLLNCSLSYFITNDTFLWGWRPWFFQPKLVQHYLRGPINLNPAELSLYNGTDPSLPIYLALNGTIYDVTAGSRIYGPGGSYHIMSGKDATRSFITGCFAEDDVPDLRGAEWTYMPLDIPSFEEKVDREMKNLREQELRKARKKVQETIEGWAEMYSGRDGKGYFEVGRVIREEGWLEGMSRRQLCKVAEGKRPKGKVEVEKEKEEREP